MSAEQIQELGVIAEPGQAGIRDGRHDHQIDNPLSLWPAP